MAEPTHISPLNTEQLVNDILATIDREREREIVSRRFGLFDRRETLEQIGELLGITRERVRQLEKSVVTRLKQQAEQGELPHVADVQDTFIESLGQLGHVARIGELSGKLTKNNSKFDQARISFLALLCPKLIVITDDDHYHHSVAIAEKHDEKTLKQHVQNLIDAIKKIGEPKPIDAVADKAGLSDPKHAEAIASTSKHLATLNGQWGLMKWPIVNPKNIRDKI
jgi:hypothetical protein